MNKAFEIHAEDFDRIIVEHNNPPAMTPMMVEANRRYWARLTKIIPTPANPPTQETS